MYIRYNIATLPLHCLVISKLNLKGTAFEETYERELNSTCGYRGNDYSMVYWEFNATKPVPNCIRKKL